MATMQASLVLHEHLSQKACRECPSALASKVLGQTDFMIENCKLEPKADAQLHIVLGQIIEGASECSGGSSQR
tara:strand:- start:10678 stop:10896 length:219 start_codon:yes stop_codon:yes gene_type:complete